MNNAVGVSLDCCIAVGSKQNQAKSSKSNPCVRSSVSYTCSQVETAMKLCR